MLHHVTGLEEEHFLLLNPVSAPCPLSALHTFAHPIIIILFTVHCRGCESPIVCSAKPGHVGTAECVHECLQV